MTRVYQRALTARFAPAARACLTLALLAVAACGCGAPGGVEPKVARRAVALESIVATRSYEPVAATRGRDGGLVLLVTESGADGARALAFPIAGVDSTARVAPLALAAPGVFESRGLAALAHGQLLIEELAGAPPASRLVLTDGRGRRQPLAPLGAGERFLARADDDQRFWSAARDVSEGGEAGRSGGELLIETSLPGGARRVVDRIDPPFEIAALSGDGALAALRRAVHAEADEIVLLDRASRDMRLLLPDRHDGRFRPLAFLGEGRLLLLLADDGGDGFRFERLTLATDARAELAPPTPSTAGDLGCFAAGIVPLASAELRLDRRCRGARRSERAELSGRGLALAPTPAGTHPVAFVPLTRMPSGTTEVVIAAAGGRWPADLWLARASSGLTPLTYALAPGLQPATFAEPEALSVPAAGAALPAELWPSWGPARGGVLWLDDDGLPTAWGELEPTFAALQSRGFAVMRYRARGSDGFGRRLRRAADGDPAGGALLDLDRAAAEFEQRLRGVNVALVGAGGWGGATALAAGARADGDRFAAVAALFPAADPFAELDLVAAAPEPRKSWLLARWGDPAGRRLVAERAAWRFPVASARRPTLVLLDRDDAASADRVAAVDAARARGAPVETALVRRLRLAPRLARDASLVLAEFLERHLAVTSGERPAR